MNEDTPEANSFEILTPAGAPPPAAPLFLILV